MGRLLRGFVALVLLLACASGVMMMRADVPGAAVLLTLYSVGFIFAAAMALER